MNATTREPRLIRLTARYQRPFDVLLAAAVAFASAGAFAGWRHGTHSGAGAAPAGAVVVIVGAALTLAFRRSHPRLVFACVLVAVLVNCSVAASPHITTIALFVATASLASRRPVREVAAAGGAAYLAILGGTLISGRSFTVAYLASQALLVAGITAVSLFLGTRRAYLDQLRARARDLERERELLAERAVADERVRIARELHDAVAHHLSLLVVQAGAIRESLPGDAPQRGVADSMADTGRQALSEMRNMLGLLRTGSGRGDGAEHEPQPGLADLEGLIEHARTAGLAVDLSVEGEQHPLPVGLDLSAYRILQESLTNVVRHSGASHAQVLLRYLPDALELWVSDDGTGAMPTADGHGIVGMRERTALFGGDLSAGPVPGGGWTVRALLPLERTR